jgi:hypothetical protein
LESTQEAFKIQIQFDQEDLISDQSQIPRLSVTFWGTKFFKSTIDDTEVRLGTTLEWPIFNQVAKEYSNYINTYREVARYTLAGIIIFMVLFCSLGTLIPTWMFLNTLQILAHLPMLNA